MGVIPQGIHYADLPYGHLITAVEGVPAGEYYLVLSYSMRYKGITELPSPTFTFDEWTSLKDLRSCIDEWVQAHPWECGVDFDEVDLWFCDCPFDSSPYDIFYIGSLENGGKWVNETYEQDLTGRYF